MILFLAIVVAALVVAALSFGRFAKGEAWRATVTPLASIIGSGFLICGPLLAKEFGGAAIVAEAALLAIAYAVGAVIRFNIAHVEPYLARAGFNDRVAWLARVTQGVLALAYAVSVAYYLKLLAEFGLRAFELAPDMQRLAGNLAVTALIAALAVVAFVGDLRRIENIAHTSVSLKLGIIAGMLAALAAFWVTRGMAEPLPPARFDSSSVPILLGLVITVQGFETSRYLGQSYSAEVRIRTMRHAQWISAAIYFLFLALLTPVLAPAARTPGVAGILDIMEGIAPLMGIFVMLGAISSQLSAAVADQIGAAGLMNEVSARRLPVKAAFLVACALALAVVWLTDPFEVVALASRAFAVFYALQCAIGMWVA